MADNYVNAVGVQAIRTWAEGKFALDSDLDTLESTVQGLVNEGGEPNVIEAVKVNNTALTPDENKAVNVTVPTKVSDLTNDGDGTTGSAFATEEYVNTNGGKIDKIRVNGALLPIVDKEVDIYVTSIPTNISEFTNDSGYQTETEVQVAINSAVASAYIYKGSVATVDDLPSSGNTTGWVYDVQSNGMNYAWNGTSWDALGAYVDTSIYWTSESGKTNTLQAMTVSEINAILNPSA